MTNWGKVFQTVQAIIYNSNSFYSGLMQTVAFAQDNPKDYPHPHSWLHFGQKTSDSSGDQIISWAREGLDKLDYFHSWDFLLLDLGDCPEIFHLYNLDCQHALIEDHFRKISPCRYNQTC